MTKKQPVTEQTPAKDIQPGDRLLAAGGNIVRVSSITNGVYLGHLSINFVGGGSGEIHPKELVSKIVKG